MSAVFSTEAREDLIAAVFYYDERSPSLGGRFEAAIFEAARRIGAAPEAWPLIDGDARFFRVDGFPYALVYFLNAPDRPVIVAVFELHQDPEKLRGRLRS